MKFLSNRDVFFRKLEAEVLHSYMSILEEMLEPCVPSTRVSSQSFPSEEWYQAYITWGETICPLLYGQLELAAKRSILHGIRLAMYSQKPSSEPFVVDKERLLDLDAVAALPKYQECERRYQKRTERLLKTQPEDCRRQMKEFFDRQKEQEKQSWIPLLAGLILATYLAAVKVMTDLEGARENPEFTQRLYDLFDQ